MRKFSLLSSALLMAFCVTARVHATEGANVKTTEIKTEGMNASSPEELFPEIQQKELIKSLQKKSVTVVDANGSTSYAEGHIPGALDFHAAEDKFVSMLPEKKSDLIVAYCGGPGCGAWQKAAEKLHAMGYTNIRHYKGGIKEWKTSKQPVEKA